ncbi:MAG: hypothetical protein OEL55_00650 [Desulfobulbaceae bacterium]|nr:hypothetical protein [Desulfobulbaceae bacterium]
MIQDYSGRYSSGGGRRQNVRRRDRGMVRSDSGMLWKAVGVLVIVAVTVGVGASLWLGWQIDSGLDELGGAKQMRQEESLRNEKLTNGRAALHSQKKIEVAAAALGLYLPTDRQVHRP